MAESPVMVKQQPRTKRLGRRDWLEGALRFVARTGVQGLKVQELAASLGATTGSLYWHFTDRADLTRSLVEHWAVVSTEALARRIEDAAASPEERLLLLMRLVSENVPTRSDLTIRTWASVDAHAARVVTRTDARRAGVVSGLFREMGFDADEVAMRTRLFLCYESCEYQVLPRLTTSKRMRLLKMRHRLLCAPPGVA